MKNLNELAKKYKTDKKIDDGIKAQNGVYGHGYAPYYERFFEGRKINNLLEIGISFGGSLFMWNEFLPGTKVHGMDISDKRFRDKRTILENQGISIYIGDQGNKEDLQIFKDQNFDVIIDDGGHRMRQQQVSLAELFPILNSRGLYVIEDLHTSTKPSFWDSFPETTTKVVIGRIIKQDKSCGSNHMTQNQMEYIIDNTESVYFSPDEKICFITKK